MIELKRKAQDNVMVLDCLSLILKRLVVCNVILPVGTETMVDHCALPPHGANSEKEHVP